MSVTIAEALQSANLPDSDTARLDAELLLAKVLDCERVYFYTWPDKVLDEKQVEAFQHLLAQRRQGHPVAHLLGYRDFWSLRLQVNPSTLIPRPETELLVETILGLDLPACAHIVDLGTGTGAIALALASEQPEWHIVGIDYSESAVDLAQTNARANELDRVRFSKGDWLSDYEGEPLDVVVSNPPYIDPDDPHLQQGDVRFEPLSALVADDKGLADIETICRQAMMHLKDKGFLLVEHGFDQGEMVRQLFLQAGYRGVMTQPDLAGLDRVTMGQKIAD